MSLSYEISSVQTDLKRKNASVRLRAVEVSREIPSRWRKRFTQTAQGLNDVKIQGSASPGRAKNTARIRTRRG